ncbi:MAG: hypothetical protein ACPL5I_07825, partial [Thermodesulfobacteriota bacterium]
WYASAIISPSQEEGENNETETKEVISPRIIPQPFIEQGIILRTKINSGSGHEQTNQDQKDFILFLRGPSPYFSFWV